MPERHRRTANVRFRVTALATVVAALVLAVTGVALVLHQQRLMIETIDETLELEADALQGRLDDLPPTLPPVIDDDGIAQVVRDGQVVAATANLGDSTAVVAPPPGGERIGTVDDVVDGESLRILSRVVTSAGGDDVIHVGASVEDVAETTSQLARSLALAFPAVLAVLAVLVWLLVGRTLAPVEAIRAEVAEIGATGLHRRVPEPATDDEIGRLARTMNAMLDRLEDAARRQQQFVADASHELRSPLARIRTEVEVDLARPDHADLVATHRSVLADAADLERLVDDLLALARADAGLEDADRRPVDLDDVVLRAVRRLREKGQVEVDTTGVSGAQVLGDARQLGRAVGNLLDNAARHAARTVTVTLAEEGDVARLAVADDGPGIPASDHERVFDRFTRLDAARTRDGGGSGLGLAITRDIVERHAGTVAVDREVGTGTRIVVRLPVVGSTGRR